MLRFGKIFWKLLTGTSLLIVLALSLSAWLTFRSMDALEDAALTRVLRGQAELVRQLAGDHIDAEHISELGGIVTRIEAGDPFGIRISIISPKGELWADSEPIDVTVGPHEESPEVEQARRQGWGEARRHSPQLMKTIKCVALRIGPQDAPRGFVRVSTPADALPIRQQLAERTGVTIMWIALCASAVFALGLAQLWSLPIRRVIRIARSLSRGDLSRRERMTGTDEMAVLSQSLDDMRQHLAEQMETIEDQRRLLESLLTQLQEGVVLAGPDGKLLLINREAVRLLDIPLEDEMKLDALAGHAVEQCIPQHGLQTMLVGGGSLPPDAEIVEEGDSQVVRVRVRSEARNRELTLLARATGIVLPGSVVRKGKTAKAPRQKTGRLLVLTDITEMDQTAQVKMDFAVNASHELRTPLSAIRAAVETLASINMVEQPDAAQHFLSVIQRKIDRLEQMVSDLLDLSRIESSTSRFIPEALVLPQFLADLQGRFKERFETKQVHWHIDLQPELQRVSANPYLLRIATDNLLDNAIKFTEPGGRVEVICHTVLDPATSRRQVAIMVRDNGCGIAEQEQKRVFERFYQVEKARTGSSRGTGLGLSIVRHAVATMNGTVRLESRLGQGTAVTIVLPYGV